MRLILSLLFVPSLAFCDPTFDDAYQVIYKLYCQSEKNLQNCSSEKFDQCYFIFNSYEKALCELDQLSLD